MLPEISRRCLVCGAAPRAGAHFCPQCGTSLSARGDGAAAASDVEAREAAGGEEVARAFEAWRGGESAAQDEARPARPAAADEADEVNEAARGSVAGEAARPETVGEGPRAPSVEASQTPVAAEVEAPRARESVTAGPPLVEPAATATPSPPVAEEVDEGDAGAASAAARQAGAVGATRRRAASVVKESIAPRVERVRDRSLVMLDEAPDDSGLRFVLLAAFMFGLFILLLVLSTVIK